MAGREHSRKELQGKLLSRGFAEDQVEVVLDKLVKADLQNDARFAEFYVDGRVRRGSGPLRIRAELRERGIDDSLITEYLDLYSEQWFDELRRVHDNKYGSELPADRKEMARRARFLEYRGFPTDLIRQLLFNQD